MADTTKTIIDIPTAAKLLGSTDGKMSSIIDDILKTTAVGPIGTTIGDSFYGINHRQLPNPLPINRDYFGLAFFTKPDMNMQAANLRAVRQLTPLLTDQPNGLNRILRCYLDSRIHRVSNAPSIISPFVDPSQAFIPLLTNTLVSMSGWPDIEVQQYTSAPGICKESFSFTDDIADIYSTFDLQTNFRNIIGDPITLMFLIWIYYQAGVFTGRMVPYPDNLIENVIDYQTRIYRLTLDYSKKRVQKIAACGASFPTTCPIGASFNFESDRPINSSNDQISVRFRCMGAMYQDDILIKEFNDTVTRFNKGMTDANRGNMYIKIPQEALLLFNNRGYPRIDPDSYELEWYVSNSLYAQVLNGKTFNNTVSGSILN